MKLNRNAQLVFAIAATTTTLASTNFAYACPPPIHYEAPPPPTTPPLPESPQLDPAYIMPNWLVFGKSSADGPREEAAKLRLEAAELVKKATQAEYRAAEYERLAKSRSDWEQSIWEQSEHVVLAHLVRIDGKADARAIFAPITQLKGKRKIGEFGFANFVPAQTSCSSDILLSEQFGIKKRAALFFFKKGRLNSETLLAELDSYTILSPVIQEAAFKAAANQGIWPPRVVKPTPSKR